MSWQLCPLCDGSGIDRSVVLSSAIPVCGVCQGKKIISELTGLPPIYSPINSNSTQDGPNFQTRES